MSGNYTVYVLKDEQGRFYKGLTGDLPRRLREHLSGHTATTRKMTNPTLVYREEFPSFAEARRREVYFKTAAGRKYLKKIISLG